MNLESSARNSLIFQPAPWPQSSGRNHIDYLRVTDPGPQLQLLHRVGDPLLASLRDPCMVLASHRR
jgi:hypothetical protein